MVIINKNTSDLKRIDQKPNINMNHKYMVPTYSNNGKTYFTGHSTWNDAYKHAKRRHVQMYRLGYNVNEPRDKVFLKARILTILDKVKPFLHKLKNRKK